MNQVIAYTIQKQLPAHMKNRLLAYYYYRFRNSYFREKLILQNLSGKLYHFEICIQDSDNLPLRFRAIAARNRVTIVSPLSRKRGDL